MCLSQKYSNVLENELSETKATVLLKSLLLLSLGNAQLTDSRLLSSFFL